MVVLNTLIHIITFAILISVTVNITKHRPKTSSLICIIIFKDERGLETKILRIVALRYCIYQTQKLPFIYLFLPLKYRCSVGRYFIVFTTSTIFSI